MTPFGSQAAAYDLIPIGPKIAMALHENGMKDSEIR